MQILRHSQIAMTRETYSEGRNRRNRRCRAGLHGYGLRLPGPRHRPGDPMRLPTGQREQHRYQTCRHEGCQRFACRVYREVQVPVLAPLRGVVAGEAAV